MIVRSRPPDLLLITQPDHAGLAADLMSDWRDGPSMRPRADDLLFAIRKHDNGWSEPDARPRVDANGTPYDFINAPLEVRQGIWPRGIDRLAGRPYAAALVAQHALTIYESYRSDPAWRRFFDTVASERERLLGLAGCSSDPDRQAFQDDYDLLRLGDLLSLTFCNGWTETVTFGGVRATLVGDTLRVAPDPFGGAAVPLKVRVRRIETRCYATDAELRDALTAAPDTWLTGAAVGH